MESSEVQTGSPKTSLNVLPPVDQFGEGMPHLYDRIGVGYSDRRHADPRIAALVRGALDGCSSILNIGAGAGSYEPRDRSVVAVDPSMVMLKQRPPGSAPSVRATAAALPFRDESFDASLAVLTLHHWPNLERGLAELRRTARERMVILTFDTSLGGFWLMDYFPDIQAIDRRIMPPPSTLERHLGRLTIVEVPIPHDCTDGFLGAYWRRPAAYLRPEVRAGMSSFAKIENVERGIAELERDLSSGDWERRYGHLLDQAEADLGYRLITA
jgi:SAM-dependent methyltransferase